MVDPAYAGNIVQIPQTIRGFLANDICCESMTKMNSMEILLMGY